jgi:hypothetical protein
VAFWDTGFTGSLAIHHWLAQPLGSSRFMGILDAADRSIAHAHVYLGSMEVTELPQLEQPPLWWKEFSTVLKSLRFDY